MGGMVVPERDSEGHPYITGGTHVEGSSYLSLCINVKAFLAASPIRAMSFKGVNYTTAVKYFDAEVGGSELVAPTQGTLDSSAKRMEFTFDFGKDLQVREGQVFSGVYCPYELYFDVAAGIHAQGDTYLAAFLEGLNLEHTKSYIADGVSSKLLERDHPSFPGDVANMFVGILRRPTATATTYGFNMNIEMFRI